MDISPLAFWISDSPDHLILSTVGRQMYPRCAANFASNNEMSNRLYKPKLGVYSTGFTPPLPRT